MLRWLILAGLLLLSACMRSPTEEMELPGMVIRYAAASSSAPILDTLSAGTVVYRFSDRGEWTEVCYRGIHGWIRLESALPPDYVQKEPLEESILRFAPDESVMVAMEEGFRSFARLSQFQPWFAPDDSLYAGFYEGLPGEDIGLVIVNVLPSFFSLIVKLSYIDPEAFEPREEELTYSSEIKRQGNLLILQNDEVPFRKAEFIRYGSKRGLLIQLSEGYKVLWLRRT